MAIFSQFSVYLRITRTKQIINLLILNNFHPVISHRRVQKEKKATNHCVRLGRSLWSANQAASPRGFEIQTLEQKIWNSTDASRLTMRATFSETINLLSKKISRFLNQRKPIRETHDHRWRKMIFPCRWTNRGEPDSIIISRVSCPSKQSYVFPRREWSIELLNTWKLDTVDISA